MRDGQNKTACVPGQFIYRKYHNDREVVYL